MTSVGVHMHAHVCYIVCICHLPVYPMCSVHFHPFSCWFILLLGDIVVVGSLFSANI